MTYINATTILVFDDGNTRRLTDPNADSRGQEYVLNEQTMTATLVVNADLGNYSFALGSAQMLSNGNLAFTSGALGPATSYFGDTIEVQPNGTQTLVQTITGLEYRSYFMSSLYGPASDLPPPGPPYPTMVNLSSAFNRVGLVDDWTTFTGGLDGVGNAFSSDALGTTLSAGGTIFNIGPAGSDDVISADGQTIALPAGNDSALQLLATAVNGAQPNQTFTVTYTDGTTQTFTQSISDWTSSQGSPGALTALTTAYRDTAGGTVQLQQVSLYDFTLMLNPSKTVSSLILPNDANVELLAATLTPATTTQVNLTSAFNPTGIVADGTTFSGGGLDGDGFALSANLIGTSVAVGGVTFNFGPAGASDAVNAAGQTIALPTGDDSAINMLAVGVNGNQPNETFTVTYTDGTTQTFTQSISDWAFPQGYAGESTALTTVYRNASSGTKQAQQVNVYEYSFMLNPNKAVSSLTLPNDANVELLAATVVPAVTTQVNLSSSFDRMGIAANGSSFSGGGLDGYGFALSANLLGTSLTVGGTTFNLGPAGTEDAVSAAGQTIALPTGDDSAINMLAVGVNGAQPNQTFTVTYTDGTTQTFTQSISDWAVPQDYPGESTALTTAYRNSSNGTEQAQQVNVYEYTFTLNPSKTVLSLTLPNDTHVDVLAATVVPAAPAPVNISSAFNRTGIVENGAKFSGGGLDGDGYALSSTLVGTSLTAGGATFNLGPAGTSDAVSAAGQTIALPAGNDATLELLALGVNGAQPNQTFTVTYSDGTTQTFTQSISDWAFPQGYAGESTALTTVYRDTSSGTKQAQQVNIYEYAFSLNPSKTVVSITLPKDANVEVLAIDVQP